LKLNPSVLYAGCYLALGFLFSDQLLRVMDTLGRIRHAALALVLGLVAVYIGFKYLRGRRRTLRVPRMTVDELRQNRKRAKRYSLWTSAPKKKTPNHKPQAPGKPQVSSPKDGL